MMAYVRDFSGIWGIKKYGMVFILSTPHFSLIFRQFSAIFPLFFCCFFGFATLLPHQWRNIAHFLRIAFFSIFFLCLKPLMPSGSPP